MKKILNIYFFEVILILIIGLIPLLWYKEGFMALGHDMSYPLAPVDFFKDRLFTWTDRLGVFGSNQTESIAGVFIHGFEALVYSSGLSLIDSQKVVFIFWFTLPGISMYILLRSLFPRREDFVIRVSGSLFYMLNHYLLQGWVIAEMTKFSIVSAIPIVVLMVINTLYRKRSILKGAAVVAVTLFFLNGGAGIPLWGGLFVASAASIIAVFLLSDDLGLVKMRRTVSFIVLSAFFVLMVNIYWIYPYLSSFTQNFSARVSSSGGVGGAIAWSQEISRNASFVNLIRLQGIPDWYDNPNHPYAANFLKNPLLIALNLGILLLALTGLISRNGEPKEQLAYKLIFLFILILGIPFTAGSHSPTGTLYDLALKYIPGFVIFRTPYYKFGMVIWFAYSLLVAVGLKNLIQILYSKLFPKRSFTIIRFTVLIIFILSLLIYNYPFLTGIFFNWSSDYSTMVKVPNYIFDVKRELDEDPYTNRLLMLPNLDWKTKYISYDWKYFSLSSVWHILSRNGGVINDAYLNDVEGEILSNIYNLIYEKGYSNLIPLLGIDRVVLWKDFFYAQDLNYSYVNFNQILSSNPAYRFDKSIGKVDFYTVVSQPRPAISIPKDLTYLLISGGSLSAVFGSPEGESIGDTFIVENIERNNTSGIKQEIVNLVNQYIVEASCISCKEALDITNGEQNSGRLLPNHWLYFLVQIKEDLQKKRIKDPKEKIDWILRTMTKKSFYIESMLYDSANYIVIKNIVNGWQNDLNELLADYNNLTEKNIKSNYSYRLYSYLWKLLLTSISWNNRINDQSLNTKIDDFGSDIKRFVQRLEALPDTELVVNSNNDRTYKLGVPREGLYKLNIHALAYQNNGKDQGKGYSPTIFINNLPIKVNQILNEYGWFETPYLQLDNDTQIILSDILKTKKYQLENFVLEAKAGKIACKDTDIGQIDPDVFYSASLNYENNSGRPVNLELMEKNDQFPDGKSKFIYKNQTETSRELNMFKVDFQYKPSERTKTALMRFCIDGGYKSSSKINVSNITITESYDDPKIFAFEYKKYIDQQSPKVEFVALNQTKYLVKINGSNSRFLLHFNNRYDPQWEIREVDSRLADQFFNGKQRVYSNGTVIEYPRQDKHIVTDIMFPKNQNIQRDQLKINYTTNGWFLGNDSDNAKSSTYLLEYKNQNTFYKSIIVSMAAVIVVTYLAIRTK